MVNKYIEEKGRVINDSSFEFALSSANRTKDWVMQLAYLLRSIVVDHVFEDGNKRTGAAIFVAYAKDNNKRYDIYKIDRIVRDLSQNKIKDLEKLRRRIKNAIS